jgi:hypothetical protein
VSATPVDAKRDALKENGTAFDSDRAMRLQELKMRVQRADYEVDPPTVAVAMIRHAVSQRRWWNPRTFCATPPAFSTSAGGPAATVPIHVSGAADSAAARSARPKHTHNS